MINLIDGRSVTPETVARMSNCRLKKTVTALQFLLSVVEEEVGKRIGKGGGGLK
jgi:predicted RNA-binding protein YlqC (UPF0109 family)